MKKLGEIAERRRKKIATILLFNFLLSTVLFSFPQSKCNGICSVEIELHDCAAIVEMTCCDMMDMNNTNSIPCEMEFADNSCDYIIDTTSDFMFVIPKTFHSNIELIRINSISLDINEKKPSLFVHVQDFIPYSSPPIYLTISTFLI